MYRRRFPRVAGVFFERKAQNADPLVRHSVEQGLDDFRREARFLVLVDVYDLKKGKNIYLRKLGRQLMLNNRISRQNNLISRE